MPIEDLDDRGEEERKGKPAEDLVPIALYPDEPEKVTFSGVSLPGDLKVEFVKFLGTTVMSLLGQLLIC